ncbi:MAG: hypothetical protein ACJ8F7_21460 [Gemmataceae bacterium]
MWTPRRILLLVGGVFVCAAAFYVYNFFLGWLDGLPVLPEKYLPSPPGIVQLPVDDLGKPDSRTERKIREAFGEGCPEMSYPIKSFMQAQGMLLVTDNLDIVDGRLRMSPLSLAVYGKVNPETDFPEINTIHCDVAYIEFERPIAYLSEISGNKIAAAEFLADDRILYNDIRKGKIHVVHNHSTPQTDDDAVMKTPGPLYFRDSAAKTPDRPQVWTRSFVDITDYQSKPPHIITAQGMNIYLAPNAVQSAENKPARDKAGKEPEQTVKAIELMKPSMILTMESDQGFAASSDEPAKKLPPDEKPRLTINTLGLFHYDYVTEKAYFEIARQGDPAIPQYVEAIRSSKKNGNDQLQCDRLDLQFTKKSSPPPAGPPADPASKSDRGGQEIAEAHATGKVVILTSDSERLYARGNELIYNRARQESVLRGLPMSAVKEGHRIQAKELILNQNEKKTLVPQVEPVRTASAQGPGTAWLTDRENQRTIEVTWNDQLLIDKEKDIDRITLTGGASFIDRERDELITGNTIKLWLAPDPNAPPPKPGENSSDSPKSKPQRLHVIGNVIARSADMEILSPPERPTDLLIVWFTDVPALPGAAPVAAAAKTEGRAASPAPLALGSATPALPPPVPALQPVTAPPPVPPPRRPMLVNARIVEAFVIRAGSKNELDKVKCFDRVTVHQEPENPKERGLDIASRTLELTRTPDGDILKLTGPLSRVDTHQMSIMGGQIVFDQKENRANVDGPGSMRMLTSSNMKGEERAEPTEINVCWNDKMNFVGAFVSYIGGVQAVQENTRALCPRMDVYLDRTLSLKHVGPDKLGPTSPAAPKSAKTKDDEQPKVAKVICHRDGLLNAPLVVVTDITVENGKMVKFQRIESPEVTFDNDESKLKAGGRGEVRMLQLGEKSSDPFAKSEPKDSKTTASPEQEMKLTRIRFDDRMEANNKLQTAYFYKNVQVVNLPSNNPNAVINEMKLEPGVLNLQCDSLQAYSTKDPQGKSFPAMIGEGHAVVESLEFHGQADTVKYVEGENQKVVFETHSSQPSKLFRMEARGQRPQEAIGKVIFYWRKTNAFRVIEAYSLSGAN